MVSATERNLVSRLMEGDNQAWEDMVRSQVRRLYGLSYRFARRRDEAEDLTQDIFVRVYQSLATFHVDSGNLNHWILRVGRNLLIDHYRATRRSRELRLHSSPAKDVGDERSANPLHNLEEAEANRLVHDALRALPPHSRNVIILRDLEGLGYQDVAASLGIPGGTVKSRLNRGRRELAQAILRSLKRKKRSSGDSRPEPSAGRAPARSPASCLI
jgi:RNA polymerase sigma-70 factor (ECF subfamily)